MSAHTIKARKQFWQLGEAPSTPKIYPSNSKSRIAQEERNDSLAKTPSAPVKKHQPASRIHPIYTKYLKNDRINLDKQLHPRSSKYIQTKAIKLKLTMNK